MGKLPAAGLNLVGGLFLTAKSSAILADRPLGVAGQRQKRFGIRGKCLGRHLENVAMLGRLETLGDWNE